MNEQDRQLYYAIFPKWCSWFYSTPYWFFIAVYVNYLNVTFIMDGQVAKGIFLILCHVPWAINVLRYRCFKDWFKFNLQVENLDDNKETD